jgi:hypothetical protein
MENIYVMIVEEVYITKDRKNNLSYKTEKYDDSNDIKKVKRKFKIIWNEK